MRVNRVLALLLMVGCAAPPAAEGRVFGEEVAPLGAAGTAHAPDAPEPASAAAGEHAPVPAAASRPDDGRARERALRHDLAEAEDPVPAALELADLLEGRQRHADALVVVETALQRVPADARLGRHRASLLRDLARREEALEALRDWDDKHPGSDPTALLEIAELEWLRARRQVAAAALAELEERFSTHPWYERNRAALQALAREVAEADRPRSVAVRDLLADLRGGRLPSVRLRALHALQEASAESRRQAVDVALADRSGPVRAEAVALAALPRGELTVLCRAALGDGDWQVRAAAARRARELPVRTACALLVEALAGEDEPVAFLAMHESLQALTGEAIPMPPGEAARADVRRRVSESWRKWWRR